MYTTRFRRGAKRLQLKRQIVIGNFDVGRIHRQVLNEIFGNFDQQVSDEPRDGRSVSEENPGLDFFSNTQRVVTVRCTGKLTSLAFWVKEQSRRTKDIP